MTSNGWCRTSKYVLFILHDRTLYRSYYPTQQYIQNSHVCTTWWHTPTSVLKLPTIYTRLCRTVAHIYTTMQVCCSYAQYGLQAKLIPGLQLYPAAGLFAYVAIDSRATITKICPTDCTLLIWQRGTLILLVSSPPQKVTLVHLRTISPNNQGIPHTTQPFVLTSSGQYSVSKMLLEFIPSPGEKKANEHCLSSTGNGLVEPLTSGPVSRSCIYLFEHDKDWEAYVTALAYACSMHTYR